MTEVWERADMIFRVQLFLVYEGHAMVEADNTCTCITGMLLLLQVPTMSHEHLIPAGFSDA